MHNALHTYCDKKYKCLHFISFYVNALCKYFSGFGEHLNKESFIVCISRPKETLRHLLTYYYVLTNQRSNPKIKKREYTRFSQATSQSF